MEKEFEWIVIILIVLSMLLRLRRFSLDLDRDDRRLNSFRNSLERRIDALKRCALRNVRVVFEKFFFPNTRTD